MEAIENADVDFLDKIKAIQYLTNDMCLGVDQVANYYDVGVEAVKTIIKRNRDEFESDGMIVLTGQDLKDLKETLTQVLGEPKLDSRTPSLTLLTKRSLLRVGLIMTNNSIATKIRNYLLNLEETSTEEQKKWAIQREVGKIERKRMTSAIAKYIPDGKHKRFAYPNYTNMLYRILFCKEAKDLREERKVKDNDALRDSFSEKELAIVEEAETIITAFIAVGFTYKQIEEQLKQKYIKQIQQKN
jgi:hypothetical protein